MAPEDSRRVEARFLFGTLVVFAILSFFVLREFIWYVVGGVLLVFAFFPVHRRVRKVFGKGSMAAFVSFLLVIAVVIGPLVLVVFLVWNDAVEFASTYDPDKLNVTIQQQLERLGIERPSADGNATVSVLANQLADRIKQFADEIGREVANEGFALALGLLIASFVIYYGFAEGESFYARLRHVIPLPDDIEESLFRDIRRVTNVVFIGNILVSVLGGVIGAISFVIFGIPNAVFWGFIMIILGILPVLGAPLVWGPWAAYMYFVEGDLVAAIGLLVINGVGVIGFVDNILRPKLIGKVANVHPILILIGVLGGLEAFGALGFVIGPLVLAVFIALIRSYTEWHPRWKERRARGSEPYYPGADIEMVPHPAGAPAPAPPPPPPSPPEADHPEDAGR